MIETPEELAEYLFTQMDYKTRMSHTVESIWLKIALFAICKSYFKEGGGTKSTEVEKLIIEKCREFKKSRG